MNGFNQYHNKLVRKRKCVAVANLTHTIRTILKIVLIVVTIGIAIYCDVLLTGKLVFFFNFTVLPVNT